jgi:hypothetical protein
MNLEATNFFSNDMYYAILKRSLSPEERLTIRGAELIEISIEKEWYDKLLNGNISVDFGFGESIEPVDNPLELLLTGPVTTFYTATTSFVAKEPCFYAILDLRPHSDKILIPESDLPFLPQAHLNLIEDMQNLVLAKISQKEYEAWPSKNNKGYLLLDFSESLSNK